MTPADTNISFLCTEICGAELSPMRVTDELCSLALEICLCWWIKWQTLTQLSGSDCSESEWDWDCVDCVGLLPPGGPVHLTIESHCPDVERAKLPMSQLVTSWSLIFFGLSSQYETPHVEAVQIWHLEIKLQWFFLWPQPDPQSPTDYTPATSTSTLLPREATE